MEKENPIKITKNEKMSQEKTSKILRKPITYVIQSWEGQDCASPPPPKHIEMKDSLKKEEIYESTSLKSNESTYLDQPHPVDRREEVHNKLEKSETKLDENTDIDETKKTYFHLSGQPSTHQDRLQLPREEMSKQHPENKNKKDYLISLGVLKLQDVRSDKPKDEEYETYLIRSTGPGPRNVFLEEEKGGLVQLNNKTQETYLITSPGWGRATGLKEEKEGLIKQKNEKKGTYNINDLRPVGGATISLNEGKRGFIKS